MVNYRVDINNSIDNRIKQQVNQVNAKYGQVLTKNGKYNGFCLISMKELLNTFENATPEEIEQLLIKYELL